MKKPTENENRKINMKTAVQMMSKKEYLSVEPSTRLQYKSHIISTIK